MLHISMCLSVLRNSWNHKSELRLLLSWWLLITYCRDTKPWLWDKTVRYRFHIYHNFHSTSWFVYLFGGVRVTRSLVLHASMFCWSLFVLLYFFFWPLCCLFFFDIQILIATLVSSNSSKTIQSIQYCIKKSLSEWLLLNANSSTIFQLYHGENKLIFNEMMMRSLCTRSTRLVVFYFIYSDSSLKQQSAYRHVAPLVHIILIPSQPVYVISP